MRKTLSLLAAAFMALHGAAETQRPKLVVGLVVDQMRWDYLYIYEKDYRDDGLRRLLDHGYSFANTMINYVPTVTAIGHASIYTGSVPALHGIAGNSFPQNGRMANCCQDTTVVAVGSSSREGLCSPRNLLASGIGDQLKLATAGKGKVVGVALKDRAAIFPAGHAADAAYWWDTSAGRFITSTYYTSQLPQWVDRINRKIATQPGKNIKTSTEGITKTFQMAEAAIAGENLGDDETTDLLAVSVSSTDAVAHTFGTRGKENYEAFMELDRQVASFIKTLDRRVGAGNYLLFLTADHGGAHNHNMLKSYKQPAGGLEMWNQMGQLNQAVGNRLGISGKIVTGENAGQLYLDHDLIGRGGKTIDEAKQAVIDELEKNENILYVVDYDRTLTTSIPEPIRERIVNGYNKKRSGDLFYVAKAGWENVSNKADYRGTTHAQWNPYDAHIPFLLYGWQVSHGETFEPTSITDIAPTICAMLHIQMPNSCVGNAKSMK